MLAVNFSWNRFIVSWATTQLSWNYLEQLILVINLKMCIYAIIRFLAMLNIISLEVVITKKRLIKTVALFLFVEPARSHGNSYIFYELPIRMNS